MERKTRKSRIPKANNGRVILQRYEDTNLALCSESESGPYAVIAYRSGGRESVAYQTPCRDRAYRFCELCMSYSSVARTLQDMLTDIALQAIVAVEKVYGVWKDGKLKLDRDDMDEELDKLYDAAVMPLQWPTQEED